MNWILRVNEFVWEDYMNMNEHYKLHSTQYLCSSSIAAIQCQFKMPGIQSFSAKCHRYNADVQYIVEHVKFNKKHRLAKGTQEKHESQHW